MDGGWAGIRGGLDGKANARRCDAECSGRRGRGGFRAGVLRLVKIHNRRE